MGWSNIAFIVVLSSSFMAAMLMKVRAARLLTQEQTNQVTTLWALRHVARMFLIFCGGALLAILAGLRVVAFPVNFYVLIVLGVVVAAWAHVSYFRKLRALQLPVAYIAAVRNSRLVVYCGILVMIAIVVYEDL